MKSKLDSAESALKDVISQALLFRVTRTLLPQLEDAASRIRNGVSEYELGGNQNPWIAADRFEEAISILSSFTATDVEVATRLNTALQKLREARDLLVSDQIRRKG